MKPTKAQIIRSYLVRSNGGEGKTALAQRIVEENPEIFTGKNAVENCRRTIYHVEGTNVFKYELKESGFKDENWSHGWLKTDGASIFIRNPEEQEKVQSLFDDFIERVERHAPKYPKPIIREGKRMLVIDPADVHIGKLSVKSETGYDYDIETACKMVREGIAGLLSETNLDSIGYITFVIGNDIIHTDTPRRTTTSGTPQDTVGQWWQSFEAAQMIYVEMIDQLRNIAPVHVVHCPSNHDYMTGFYLAQLLQAWYRNDKATTFDCSIQQRKYIHFGANLIGLSHGDGAKHNELQFLMTKEARNYISKTKFRYFYCHHVHHKDRKKYTGKAKNSEKDLTAVTVIDTEYTPPEDTVHVEMIRTPSPPDGWHSRNGYVNQQALEGFIHCPVKGQVGRITHYF